MNSRKALLIIVGFLLIFIGLGYLSGGWWSDMGSKAIDNKHNLEFTGIDLIDINLDFGRVNITQEERQDIFIHYHGRTSSRNQENLDIRTSASKMLVEGKSKRRFNFGLGTRVNSDLSLDIVLPISYDGDLSLEAKLGSIRIDGVKLKKLEVEGDLGDIDIRDLVGNVKVYTNLGSVKLYNILGDMEVVTNLGSIDFELEELKSDIKAKSDAGSIKMILPNNSNLNIEAETDLGSVKTDLPLEILEQSNKKLRGKMGNGQYDIYLSVDLGSIKINGKW